MKGRPQLPQGWTMSPGRAGWWLVRDERGTPACEGETRQEAIDAAQEMAAEIEAES